MRVTPAGIETSTVLNPDASAGDAALARLLVPPRTALRAAEALPATATGFTTSAWDAAATINYLPNLLTRMGVENVQQTLNTELGFDLQRDLAAWMGNEIATATLPGDALGESVYLIAVRDEAAAANGIAKVMPALKNGVGRLSDVLESEGMPTDQLGFELRGTTLAPSTFSLAGTSVTSYPVADGTAVYTAIRGGFLYIATSQAAMSGALAGGPRLSTNANYRALTARAAAGATSYGFSDVGGTLKTAAPMMRDALEMAFSLTGDLPARDAQALQKQISGLIDLAAQRAGVQVSWTENTANGIRMRSFLPVKW
jgi:hypothetical protein